jgi:thioester reductase-like protein
LEAGRLWDESYESRIIPVPGDLSQPLLGLSPEQFHSLAEKIDTIYHNGALITMTYPYHALKPANVDGTREVLRLASRVRAKPVHYMSTITVFASHGDAEIIYERDEPEPPVRQSNLPVGYAQSKWVAEQLVITARSRGIPCAIYRPGRITGDSRTGAWKLNDVSCMFLIGCLQAGVIPEDRGEMLIMPVDYASKAIVRLSLRRESLGEVFHLMNERTIPWTSLIEYLRAFGYPVEARPYVEWRRAIERSPENALHPLLPTLPGEDEYENDLAEPEITKGRKTQFDRSNAFATLADCGVAPPVVDSSLIAKYLTHLIEIGVLAPPPLLSKSTGPLGG